MIDGLNILAIVPARGGSKGLPRKNVLDLAGRPLIAWTLDAAANSRYIDRCVVSTDDADIARVARAHGGDVPFIRPAALAGDSADTFGALAHAIKRLPGYDLLVILQPTSPLRIADDIDGAIDTMMRHHAPACVSVMEPSKSPFWSYRIDERNQLSPLIDETYSRMRRQDLPTSVVLNGAVYVAQIDWLLKHKSCLGKRTVPYVMPAERSVDIDSAFDMELAELHLRHSERSSAA